MNRGKLSLYLTIVNLDGGKKCFYLKIEINGTHLFIIKNLKLLMLGFEAYQLLFNWIIVICDLKIKN